MIGVIILILLASRMIESKRLQDYDMFKGSSFEASSSTILTLKTHSLLACSATCASQETCCAGFFDNNSRECLIDTCCRPDQIGHANRIVFSKITEQPEPADCDETGYTNGMESFLFGSYLAQVYCVMDEHCGGWILIQRRIDGSVNFNSNWEDYKRGFGKCPGECWLGNMAISAITTHGNYMLRIDIEDFNGNKKYALYNTFFVGGETDNFKLTIGGYTGDAEDALGWLSGSAFSTPGNDNDNADWDCAALYNSGWWFNACHSGNLNGEYLFGQDNRQFTGLTWTVDVGGSSSYSLKSSRMMIRRK